MIPFNAELSGLIFERLTIVYRISYDLFLSRTILHTWREWFTDTVLFVLFSFPLSLSLLFFLILSVKTV